MDFNSVVALPDGWAGAKRVTANKQHAANYSGIAGNRASASVG